MARKARIWMVGLVRIFASNFGRQSLVVISSKA